MAHFRFNLHAHHDALTRQNIDKERIKMGNLLIFACFFLYTASMAAKGIFAAEVKYIIDMWGLTQAKAQMANTFYFVAYGLVQVFLSILMSKINIRKYVIVTVPVAAIFTALMGVATKIEHIWIYFGLGGAFQAAIYAGCNFVLTAYLPNSLLTTGNKVMNTGYAVGTVFAYAISALFIGKDLWQMPYYITAVIFLISLINFAIVSKVASKFKRVNFMLDECVKTDGKNTPSGTQNELIKLNSKKEYVVFYAFVLILSFVLTSLYYSVMNFITSTLVEVHGVSQDVSIYIAIIAPIAIVSGPMMTISACEKDKNFIRQAILFLFIILPFSLLLAFFYQVNVILYLVLAVIFVVLANGIKAIVLSVVAYKMKSQINVASYCAISNAVASLSAGITPVVIGAIKDAHGWMAGYFVSFGVIVFSIILITIINVLIKNKKVK
jgi:sugar phosphate permease